MAIESRAIQEGRYITRFIAGEPIPPELERRQLLMKWFTRDRETFEGMRRELLDRIHRLPASLGTAITGKRITWGHLLAYLGLSHIPEGTELPMRIPNVRGDLVDVTYRVERVFNLAPAWMDVEVQAFGLVPLHRNNAPRLLLFAGTQNILEAISDSIPLLSAGETLYYLGKQEILQWVGTQEVHVFGESLGGTLGFLLAFDRPSLVTVHAYVAPGLLPWSVKGPIRGYAFIDPDDIISHCYIYPPGIKVIEIKRELRGSYLTFWHHIQIFTPPPDLVFQPVEASHLPVTRHRIASTVVYQLSCCALLPLLLLTYVVYLPSRAVYIASGKIRSKL